MELLLWTVAAALLMCGLVLTIRRRMFWGIGFILAGMLTGVGASSAVA